MGGTPRERSASTRRSARSGSGPSWPTAREPGCAATASGRRSANCFGTSSPSTSVKNVVLTTTAALGRLEEFRLHVRTGLAHELEPCDLEEVLLQVAVYAGVPAANAAFHVASEVLNEKPH